MKSDKLIELVAPAGSRESLNAAIGEGADAVYMGLRDFNARVRAKNFSYNQFEGIIDRAHQLGKKIYITLNTLFEERESLKMYNLIKYISLVGPDAVIVQDPGVIYMINKYFPTLRIHASTQMNISTASGINFLSKNNIKRVVISRESSLEDIKEIVANTGVELEVFAHGALCISHSGLCLFSSYFGGKSANRGRCTQPCRRLYKTTEGKDGYFFSPKDLMLIDAVPQLIEAGVHSLKIEGRMKTYQYTANVVKAYRHMIDNYSEDKDKALQEAKEILSNDFSRAKTQYLFYDTNNTDFLSKSNSGETGIFIGYIKDIVTRDDIRYALLDSSSYIIKENDNCRFHSKNDINRKSTKVKNIIKKQNYQGIEAPSEFQQGDLVYLVQKSGFDRKYNEVIPKNLSKYKRHPGNTKPPEETRINKFYKSLKDGVYIKTNDTNHLFIIQSVKPNALIVHFSENNCTEFKNNLSKTSFKPSDIIIYLEPYMSVESEKWLINETEYIINNFKTVIVNNLSQVHILSKYDIELIAGPYLYTLNQYSVRFFDKNKIDHIVAPIEISKQNLFTLSENFSRKKWLITIFSYPELFQIKADLKKLYKFKIFSDNMTGFRFSINNLKNKSSVIPESPFSIVDKISLLRKRGFSKFIVDLSFMEINKKSYKSILIDVESSNTIAGTKRFNWNDGFYNDPVKKL